MGCLFAGVVALLALAIPASIAPASLVGALIVLAALTAAGLGAARLRPKRVEELTGTRTKRSAEKRIAIAAALYAAVVVAVHFAAR